MGLIHSTNSGEEFKEIMTNVLQADPITIKGKGALTTLGIDVSEEEYLNKVYVQPFTLFRQEFSEQPNEMADPDMEIGYAKELKFNVLNDAKSSFERRLGGLRDSLFVIKGGAGSGKTTYVHHLQQEFSDIRFCFCDFEEAIKAISLFGCPYDFESKFDSNIWKFVSIAASKATHIIFENKAKDYFDSHSEYIRRLLYVYRKYFNILEGKITIVDEGAMRDFFECMIEYAEGNLSIYEFSNRISKHVEKKFEEFYCQNKSKEAVTYICSILIRLFLCLNRINAEEGVTKKYICVIDNIEYFVPFDETHPIQECELQDILNGVADSSRLIRPIIAKWKLLFPQYETFYGFLLVTRDTSVSLAEYRQYEDYMRESEIDITAWFWVDDICRKKAEYFAQIMEKLKDNTYYSAYKNIIGDISQYNWGMHNVVCQMYNYNYRRTGLDVINAVAVQPENVLIDFNEKWKNSSGHSAQVAVRHMCRKYVFRILLDYIQRTGYFDLLLVERKNASARKNNDIEEENNKSSYARKVATTLYRLSLNENNDCEFLSFPELIESILEPPFFEDKVQSEEIDDLASILYLMNETRNDKTNWAPLIVIKFDSEQVYNKDNLIGELNKQWKRYLNRNKKKDLYMDKYGVRITSAGKFFARMVPDFEYFACRFVPEYPALFVKENLKATRDGSFQCLKIISAVRENAFQCIDEVLKRDNQFFSSTGRSNSEKVKFNYLYDDRSVYKWLYKSGKDKTLMPHPLRILNNQIGYLQLYVKYVTGLSEQEICDENKQKIIEEIQKEIEKYKEKIQEIMKKYESYFRI